MKRLLPCFLVFTAAFFGGTLKPFAQASARYQAHLRIAKKHGVPVLKSQQQVNALAAKKKLAKVSGGTGYKLYRLTHSTPFLAPRAKKVLSEVARSFYSRTKSTFTVTSLSRTVHAQNRLRKVNMNAASGLSAHNYGSAFDISYVRFNGKKGTNRRLEKALYTVLTEYQAKGKLLFIKEYNVKCFHITVR